MCILIPFEPFRSAPIAVEGRWYGELREDRKVTKVSGMTLFFSEGVGCTVAELVAEKNKLSHRAKAFEDLPKKLMKNIPLSLYIHFPV